MLRRVSFGALRAHKFQTTLINNDLLVKSSIKFGNMSKSTTVPKVVDFKQVKSLPDDILLIDVREPSELQQVGVLPKSINIPLGNVENAFKQLTPDEFKQLYGCNKPDLNNSMVFSCKAGIRSAKAMKILENLGYKNTSNYQGGFDDWLEQTQKPSA